VQTRVVALALRRFKVSFSLTFPKKVAFFSFMGDVGAEMVLELGPGVMALLGGFGSYSIIKLIRF